jgi:hypothetical protein
VARCPAAGRLRQYLVTAELAWDRAATALASCGLPLSDAATVLAAVRQRAEVDVIEMLGHE